MDAEASITDYWIFNLVENHLEVYSEPYADYLPNQAIALPYFPDSLLDLSKVFPGIGR